ncbi:MAG: hypothetical protein Q4F11_06065 [Eubacteriales bacterium]|nr:hypothetical protein [Eubacteriales bacterium]
MLIKLGNIENMVTVLQSVMKKKLPVKLSYAVSKNVKTLTSECENLYEQRIKILNDSSSKDDKGNPVIKDNQYVFNSDDEKSGAIKAITELLNTEVDVEIMNISMNDVEKCDEAKYDALTGIELDEVMKMVK